MRCLASHWVTCRFDDIAKRLVEYTRALQQEIHLVSNLVQQIDFLGDVNSVPHAHYGSLMAALGRIGTLSGCHGGNVNQCQTSRMIAFLDKYVLGRLDVHRVVVQMLRYTLMHTGHCDISMIRRARSRIHGGGYFDDLPGSVVHYTLTQVDCAYADHLRDCARLVKDNADSNFCAQHLPCCARYELGPRRRGVRGRDARRSGETPVPRPSTRRSRWSRNR